MLNANANTSTVLKPGSFFPFSSCEMYTLPSPVCSARYVCVHPLSFLNFLILAPKRTQISVAMPNSMALCFAVCLADRLSQFKNASYMPHPDDYPSRSAVATGFGLCLLVTFIVMGFVTFGA